MSSSKKSMKFSRENVDSLKWIKKEFGMSNLDNALSMLISHWEHMCQAEHTVHWSAIRVWVQTKRAEVMSDEHKEFLEAFVPL